MQPDGMGADRYNERQNMRAAQEQEDSASHDVWAIDSDGEMLYVAESAWTENAAESECDACNSLLEAKPEKFPEVDRFEIRER